MRRVAVLFAWFALAAPAVAQDASEVGQLRLYVQQLEEQVRQLTGQNERLAYELNQLRSVPGKPVPPPQAGFTPGFGEPPPGGQGALTPGPTPGQAEAPQDLGVLSVSPDDPLIAPDGAGGPMDLSDLAGGPATASVDPQIGAPFDQPPPAEGLAPTVALSGSPRDEYDLAYGYVLTGEYALAETSFRDWLAAFPGDPQAVDARFWLGESHFAQREYREAATAFFAVYQAAPDSAKAPDALFKLGAALAQLGETKAACGTLAEVGRKYPGASAALKGRVDGEAARAGCS